MSENKNFLNTAKNSLIERATFYYLDRRDGLNMSDATDYKDHFRQLAILLYYIDSADSITGIVSLIESNELGSIGIFKEDLEDFLEEVLKETYKK